MIKVENLRKVFRSEDIEIETIALDGVSISMSSLRKTFLRFSTLIIVFSL